MKKYILFVLCIIIIFSYVFFPDYDNLQVTFVDVGQGDSTVLFFPDSEVMVIDAGEKSEVGSLITFLKSNRVKEIDVLVATHPHSDHIGGMTELLSEFKVSKVYMPKVVHDTSIYYSFLESITEQEIDVTEAKGGVSIYPEDSLIKADFLAPNSGEYEELNNYSAVLKVSYKDISFLFTGDAEAESEYEMLNQDYDLKADVLKVAHHGSNTSSTRRFIDAVSPKFAVISADGESYSHPHNETLDRLYGVNIIKTYEEGNISFETDGITLERKQDLYEIFD
ncbi:MAG: MBL fold metallo-hydrolase [Clostridia bacterium]|nr:MBL fold metallo-hydrolase [Clostridia bacterium]MBQ9997722.1 MBL fold metallo-hydrolase [Clostridia bacterium]